jgi:phytoene dehydrogenase-like protein
MFVPYRDGSSVRYWRDPAKTQADLERVNPADAARYPEWERLWSRAASIVGPFFLEAPPSHEDLRARAEQLGESELFDRLLTEPLADISASFFSDPGVQAATVSVGEIGDPWAQGSAWAESYFHPGPGGFGFGVVEGGMGAITKAMAESARVAGVEIRTESEVDQILVDDSRAIGVRLRGGEEVRSRVVVSNADPKRTLLALVPSGALEQPFRRQVSELSTRVSYLKFHCLLERLPDLSRYDGTPSGDESPAYIKIAPSLEHYRAAYASAVAGEPAAEPIVHLQVPTVFDRTLTRRDVHVVSIWAQYAAPQLAESTWEEKRTAVGEALIDYVADYVPNFRSDMQEWRLFTPADLEQRVGLTDGNIRHLDTIPGQMFGQRPFPGAGYETPVSSLFLCGAGTHPGGEVTGAPGHNAARAVIDKLAPT